MNFSQLKRNTYRLITVPVLAILFTACNNSDDAGNNSTTGNAEVKGDTTATVANTAATPARKRKGRVSTSNSADDPNAKMEMDKQGYYTRTEVAPAFAGGQSSLDDYIVNNIEYPQEAIDNNIEGVVNVHFAIDEKGNISNVTATGTKLGYGLEEEAIKVVSNMPKWMPAQVKGKNVKTWRTLPINYRLDA